IDCQPFAASDQLRSSDSTQIRCSPLKQMGIVLGRSTLAPHVINAIGKCQQLKSLSLKNITVVGNQFTTLLIACANVGHVAGRVGTNGVPKVRASGLIKLCLDRFNATESGPIPFSTLAPLPCLEHLRIGAIFGMTSEAQLKLLMLCPNLRSFYWRRFMFEDHFLMDEWVDYIESGMWPLLTSLDVSGVEFHDEGLSRFIKSRLFPLEKLLVENTVFGPIAYNSIISAERHYNHIQELEIFKCTEVTSGMIRGLLTAMPALRYFSAGRLYVTDILDTPGVDCNGDGRSQEWTCKNIRTLRLCIDMGQEFDPSCSEYAERQRQAHSGDVRSLTLKHRLPDEYYLLEDLRRLHSIHVEYRTFARPRPNLSLLANLIENYSTSLTRLEIYGGSYHLEPRTFEVIGMCQRLKSLTLNRVSMTGQGFTALLEACANIGHAAGEIGTDSMPKPRLRAGGLNTLRLEHLEAEYGEMVPFSTPAPLLSLEHLRIGNVLGIVSEAQLKLPVLFPNLRSLYWGSIEPSEHFSIYDWVDHIQSGMWPLLTSLEVLGGKFHDSGLSRFIESRRLSLEKLLVTRTGFGPMAYNSLISREQHYNHIQELEIYGCVDVTGHMIQKFMTTMPALRYFSAGRLRATDILDVPGMDSNGDDHGQEWICKNIRTLRLCIDMGLESDPSTLEYVERQKHIYRRLSDLKSLEVLNVSRKLGPHGWHEDAQRLDLRLSAGLGQLASLKRIREFLFEPGQSLTLKDIEWMIKTWKLLEVIAQDMNTDEKINKRLVRTLEDHGIECKWL
ncbi:hypothetical protein BGZ79_000559, partial [Entomortierella chlamydospora]